jgi:uncharacterized OsmC-like protein
MNDPKVTVRLRQQHDYLFSIDFGAGLPVLLADEPPPLGAGAGPSPMQLLASSVGNCLSASLLFALRKFKLDAEPLSTEARGEIGRNEQGRLRVLGIDVAISLGRAVGDAPHLQRVLAQFEQFCIVGQSVAQGIPVRVRVLAVDGAVLHGG